MRPFIQDTERVLNSTNDLLKTSVYAENLVNVIENTPTDKVFTIGVFGGWGTGKSSIIRTAQKTIEGSHSDMKFITYDAWKYANDSFRRMFLLKIQQELKMKPTEEMRRFYQSEISESEPRTTLSAKGIAIAVAVLAIISTIIFLIPCVSITWKVAIPTIGTLGTFFLALINGCFYDLKISFSKPALFAPEQFEDCFKEMMSKCLKRKNWFQKKWSAIKDYVEVGEVSVVGLEKLVIVIDNIDRCPSDMAYQMLTDIKTFLSDLDYNLVFIVPVDDEALKKHLFRRWNKGNEEDFNREKEEFLRKFFNITLRIKPHQEAELQHFTHKIDEENHLGFSSDTLAIVSKEFADNPRRIIQLLNNLSGEIALYDDEFVKKYEPAICAALILREEYSDFYKNTTKNLNLLINPLANEGKQNAVVSDSLKGFLRITEAVFRRTPLDVKRRIFTNTSSIFSDLSEDIRKSVESFDAEKVIAFAHENELLRTNLVDYTLDKLKVDIKYFATAQVSQWIDFICKLHQASIIDHSRFSEIDEQLSPFFEDAVSVTSDAAALCNMASSMSSMGIPTLRRSILGFMKQENAFSLDNFDIILKCFLTYFTGREDCKEISPVVESYFIDRQINQSIPYTEFQIKQLFDESFVAKLIEHLSSMDDESTMGNITWCLKKNKNLSRDLYGSLLGKCSALFGDTRGKSFKQYLDFIRHLEPFWAVTDIGSLEDEAKGIYELVVGIRGIPNPPYRNQPQHDSKVTILNEVDEESAKPVISFCYDILRVTGGKVDVSDSINKLFQVNKQAVVDGALEIHNLGITIAPLAHILLQTTDYQLANDRAILEIVLTQQKDGSMMLNDDEITKKIRSLVDHSSIKEVEDLLDVIIGNESVSAMVVEYVASLDSGTINSLPISISKHAVSGFNRDNASAFKDNPAFLIQVLKQGRASQKEVVVRLMKEKIIAEEDLENVLLVLNNLETDNQTLLKSLIGELETLKDETVTEEIKNGISELITKLSSYLKKPKAKINFLGKIKKSEK